MSVDRGEFRRYLVEVYLSRSADVREVSARAGAMDGPRVRYVETMFLPEDETCLFVFEAASPEEVAVAARTTGLSFDRIVEAVRV